MSFIDVFERYETVRSCEMDEVVRLWKLRSSVHSPVSILMESVVTKGLGSRANLSSAVRTSGEVCLSREVLVTFDSAGRLERSASSSSGCSVFPTSFSELSLSTVLLSQGVILYGRVGDMVGFELKCSLDLVAKAPPVVGR